MHNTQYTKRNMRYGFTLIEVLVAIILVGLAVASLMGANISFSKSNGTGDDLSTAEFLIEQIRDRTALLDYDNLHNLDGISYSPPIDADGQQLSGLSALSQQVIVENVSDSNFELVVADGSSNFLRVTAKVIRNGKEISSANWIRAEY